MLTDTMSMGSKHGLSKLKLFWALSRTPHALIDMATPALAALLCLGYFPPAHITIIGLITAFAGYTAVYALNDVVDYQADKEKVKLDGYPGMEDDLDSIWVRHPMAQGFLSYKEGLTWSLAWGGVALVGAYVLNPVCVLIFAAGCVLEAVYCMLWKVSPFRAAVNGIVKACGALAAVYAVNPAPSPLLLTVLFLWIFVWEIGGQNIPNDWTDIEEDKRFKAQTIPVCLGANRAAALMVGALVLAFLLNQALLYVSGMDFRYHHYLAAVVINVYFLLLPALRAYETAARRHVMRLFNRASYYPLAMLLLVLYRIMVG